MSEEKQQAASWWQSIPGMLTASATAITAVAGLIVALHSAGLLGGEPDAPARAQQESSPPSQEVTHTKEVTFNKDGGTENTQTSPQLDESVDFESTGSVKLSFAMVEHACSSLRLHLYLDNSPDAVVETEYFDQSTGIVDLGLLSPGPHTLRISPEGRKGGCNAGSLESWGGTVKLYLSGAG